MLRGVNVGGHNRLRMPEFASALESVGLEGAVTYLQSGNAVFLARGQPSEVGRTVASMLEQRFGLSVPVLVRTSEELQRVLDGNPFGAIEEDSTKLLVTFLEDGPARASSAIERPPNCGRDDFAVVGREIFLHCPDGYGRTKLTNEFFERRLGVTATTRNWRTVVALAEMAAGLPAAR